MTLFLYTNVGWSTEKNDKEFFKASGELFRSYWNTTAISTYCYKNTNSEASKNYRASFESWKKLNEPILLMVHKKTEVELNPNNSDKIKTKLNDGYKDIIKTILKNLNKEMNSYSKNKLLHFCNSFHSYMKKNNLDLNVKNNESYQYMYNM